ncbi:MAG: hypothetical protein WA003_17540, partial [Desulfuromonadaceae bacterium]
RRSISYPELIILPPMRIAFGLQVQMWESCCSPVPMFDHGVKSVYRANPVGLFSVNHVAAVDHFFCLSFADQPDKPLAASAEGDQASSDTQEAKAGGL